MNDRQAFRDGHFQELSPFSGKALINVLVTLALVALIGAVLLAWLIDPPVTEERTSGQEAVIPWSPHPKQDTHERLYR